MITTKSQLVRGALYGILVVPIITILPLALVVLIFAVPVGLWEGADSASAAQRRRPATEG